MRAMTRSLLFQSHPACGTYDDIISYYKGNPVYTVDGQKPVHTVEGTSYHFDDLYLGTTYTAFVMAHTDSDDKSNVPVTKLEFATKPVEITNLTADTVTTDSITLKWDPFPVPDAELMITVVDDMPDCLSMQEVLEIQNDTANFSDEELEAYVTEKYGEEGWAFLAKYFDRTYQPFRTIEDYADTQLSLLELEENHNYNFLLIPSYHGKLLSESTCKGIKVRTKAQPVFRNLSAEAESYDSLHVTWDALETYADSISVTCCTGIPEIKATEGADSFDVTAYPEYSGVSAEGLDISKTGCTFDNLAPDTLYTIIAEVRCNHRNRVSVTQIRTPKVEAYVTDLNAALEDGRLHVTFTRPEGDIAVYLFVISDPGSTALSEPTFKEVYALNGQFACTAILSAGETEYTVEGMNGGEYAIAAFAMPNIHGSYTEEYTDHGVSITVKAAETTTSATETATTVTESTTTSTGNAAVTTESTTASAESTTTTTDTTSVSTDTTTVSTETTTLSSDTETTVPSGMTESSDTTTATTASTDTTVTTTDTSSSTESGTDVHTDSRIKFWRKVAASAMQYRTVRRLLLFLISSMRRTPPVCGIRC